MNTIKELQSIFSTVGLDYVKKVGEGANQNNVVNTWYISSSRTIRKFNYKETTYNISLYFLSRNEYKARINDKLLNAIKKLGFIVKKDNFYDILNRGDIEIMVTNRCSKEGF